MQIVRYMDIQFKRQHKIHPMKDTIKLVVGILALSFLIFQFQKIGKKKNMHGKKTMTIAWCQKVAPNWSSALL